jgi:thiol-disulfide isomerase/thioredoxin
MNKNIILIIVLIAIVGVIYYINSTKVSIPDVIVEEPVKEEVLQEEEQEKTQTQKNTKPGFSDYFKDDEAIKKKSVLYQEAPELTGIAGYINTDSDIKIQDLKGKVVLVDFWTYTCINCIRTLPYLKAWDDNYKEDGLVIVGVHTPEFKFEQEYDNVKDAVEKYELKYPIVQDNSYATWRAYKNRWWPHKYLIDIDGFVVYDHIGEGGYEETETFIQELLKEKNERMGEDKVIDKNIERPENVVEVTGRVATPEIYFGYDFARGNFGNEEGIVPNQIIDYKLPEKLIFNQAYLDGQWKSDGDNMELVSDEGLVVLPYQAKVVNVVMGSEQGSDIEVFIDGINVNENSKGFDVEDNKVVVKDSKLYNVVDYEYEPHTVALSVKGKGFKIYTFTFG